MNFLSVDIESCRRLGHRFRMVGSDKTPMKRSLACLTCSAETGKNAYAAYGEETLSWGQWRTAPRVEPTET